jgi:hypothetical protein
MRHNTVKDKMNIVPVILSGGSGSRLWPLSREEFPKQLQPLTSEKSLLQETALRLGTVDGLDIQRGNGLTIVELLLDRFEHGGVQRIERLLHGVHLHGHVPRPQALAPTGRDL